MIKNAKAIFIFIMAIPLLFLCPSLAFAEVKEIIAEGTYNMGDGETPFVAEERALINAKRVALEEAGTYVQSYSETENMQLKKDIIQVVSSGIMEVSILTKKREVTSDSIKFSVRIRATIRLDKIGEMAKFVKDNNISRDYKIIYESYDKNQKEIDRLKKPLREAKDKRRQAYLENQIAEKEDLFQANNWYEKGISYFLKGENDEAIEALTKAMSIKPDFTEAYRLRGSAYFKKGTYDKSIEDCNKVISLRPNDLLVSLLRGVSYCQLGDYQKALSDLNKAISLKSEIKEREPELRSLAYYWRAVTLINLESDVKKVLADLDKSIILNSNHAAAYSKRGFIYATELKNYKKALQDINKAISIDPSNYEPYYNRGLLYDELGIIQSAINDYEKVIERKPDFKMACNLLCFRYSRAEKHHEAIQMCGRAIELENNPNLLSVNYTARGFSYLRLDDTEKATSDFRKAIEIDPSNGEPYFWICLAYDDINYCKLAAKLGSQFAQSYLNKKGIAW